MELPGDIWPQDHLQEILLAVSEQSPGKGLEERRWKYFKIWCEGGGKLWMERPMKSPRSHPPHLFAQTCAWGWASHYYAAKAETISGSPWLQREIIRPEYEWISSFILISFIHSLHLSFGLSCLFQIGNGTWVIISCSRCSWEGYVLNTVINSADSHTFYEENKAGWWEETGRGGRRLSHQLLSPNTQEKTSLVVWGRW